MTPRARRQHDAARAAYGDGRQATPPGAERSLRDALERIAAHADRHLHPTGEFDPECGWVHFATYDEEVARAALDAADKSQEEYDHLPGPTMEYRKPGKDHEHRFPIPQADQPEARNAAIAEAERIHIEKNEEQR